MLKAYQAHIDHVFQLSQVAGLGILIEARLQWLWWSYDLYLQPAQISVPMVLSGHSHQYLFNDTSKFCNCTSLDDNDEY